MTEADLAEKVIKWLENKGWDVYQEVEATGGIADIVAVKDDVVWVVETKTALTFSLIDQARDRLIGADLVSVAVPSTARRSRGGTAYWVLRHFDVGLIQVDRKPDWNGKVRVNETFKPKEHKSSIYHVNRLRSSLEPEHKTYAKAGGTNGKRWTPFKRTCRNAVSYIKANGSCTVRGLMEGIEHHYANDSSARAHLIGSVDGGLIPELALDRTCRPMQVKVKE